MPLRAATRREQTLLQENAVARSLSRLSTALPAAVLPGTLAPVWIPGVLHTVLIWKLPDWAIIRPIEEISGSRQEEILTGTRGQDE
jgi:hypothetical protein